MAAVRCGSAGRAGLSAAIGLTDGAKFLRDTTSGDVVKDCATLVDKNPFTPWLRER